MSRNYTIVKPAKVVLTNAVFAEELTGETKIDCAGFIEFFQFILWQHEVDHFKVFL